VPVTGYVPFINKFTFATSLGRIYGVGNGVGCGAERRGRRSWGGGPRLGLAMCYTERLDRVELDDARNGGTRKTFERKRWIGDSPYSKGKGVAGHVTPGPDYGQ